MREKTKYLTSFKNFSFIFFAPIQAFNALLTLCKDAMCLRITIHAP